MIAKAEKNKRKISFGLKLLINGLAVTAIIIVLVAMSLSQFTNVMDEIVGVRNHAESVIRLKTAVASVRLQGLESTLIASTGGSPPDPQGLKAEVGKIRETAGKTLDNLGQSGNRQDKIGKEKLSALRQQIENYFEKASRPYDLLGEGEVLDASEYEAGTLGPLFMQAQSVANEAFEQSMDNLTSTLIERNQHLRKRLYILGGISILFSILGLALLYRAAQKDIYLPVRSLIERLTAASSHVKGTTGQLSSSSRQLAEGSSEQAASIEETSSSLEEMSTMTKQNADNSGQADNLMKEANQIVGQANQSMVELTGSMQEISKASEETSKIIKTIDEIAFQTNLLALNAAVEAARAGEAGAGFAVVADEVRNLAMRAADAAKNTADLIEGTVKKVTEGSELVNRTNEAFIHVADSSSKVGELVGEIAAASKEQAQGIEQVNTAVSEMDKVTQSNAANAEETSSASEELSAQAEQMNSVVAEMVALVGGSGNGAKAEHPAVMHTAKAKINKAPAVHKAKEVTPDKLIPMGDEDFKDF